MAHGNATDPAAHAVAEFSASSAREGTGVVAADEIIEREIAAERGHNGRATALARTAGSLALLTWAGIEVAAGGVAAWRAALPWLAAHAAASCLALPALRGNERLAQMSFLLVATLDVATLWAVGHALVGAAGPTAARGLAVSLSISIAAQALLIMATAMWMRADAILLTTAAGCVGVVTFTARTQLGMTGTGSALAVLAIAALAALYAVRRSRLTLIRIALQGARLIATRDVLARTLDSEHPVVSDAQVGVFVVDRQRRVRTWNTLIAEKFGRTAEDVRGREIGAAVPAELAEPLMDAAARALAGEAVALPDKRVAGARGDMWFSIAVGPTRDDRGVPIAATGIVRDVTAQQRAERELQNTWASFRGLIESSPDGVVVHSGGKVVYTNSNLRQLLGIDEHTCGVNCPVMDFVHPNERDALQARLDAVYGPGEVSTPRETLLVHRDGTVIPAEIRGVDVTFDNAPAVLAVIRDLRGRKAAETQLAVNDRLASLGLFAASVVHEINSPLAALSANIEYLASVIRDLAGTGLSVVQRTDLLHTLDDAHDAAVKIRTIVRDMRAFSRDEGGATAPVALPGVIESTLRVAWMEIRGRARLVKDIAPAPAVLADEARLGQVFLNLLVNAAQAIEPGAPEANEIRIVVDTTPEGDARVEIRDTGCGMSSATMARMFDPLFTTKQPGIGTGLGLPICRRIVTELGGRIEVDSVVDRGSTFRVILPPAAIIPAQRQEGAGAAADAGPRWRVLVIDDEAAVLRAMTRLLGRRHDVEVFDDARAALQRIATGARFDAIVCDILMPTLSGPAFYERLDATAPEQAARVIFMTGGTFAPEVVQFLEGCGRPRLQKPFPFDELEREIATVAQR